MTADDPGTRLANTAAPEGVRCSDAERERTAHTLHKAVSEGRLSLAEVEERTATIYAAQYRHELDAVVADLPPDEKPVTGWRPVLAVAHRQLVADLVMLTGRSGAMSNPRRRAALLAVLMLMVVALGALAVHGFIDGGLEHHAVGHD